MCFLLRGVGRREVAGGWLDLGSFAVDIMVIRSGCVFF